jgi:hypothetical protein
MKTTFTLLATLLTAAISFGQSFSLEQTTNTYQEIQSATDITGGELWDDDEWTLPIGFDFELFGKTYTEFHLHANGFITDTLANGSVMKLGLDGPDFVDGAFLIDPSNPIPITYELSGTAGSQILKLQWKNANIWGADSTNIANYQIWFIESTGDIEYHFGNTKLDATPGVSVQIYTSGAQLDDGFALSGTPTSAVSSTIINIKMSEAPSEDGVYKFKRTGNSPTTAIANPKLTKNNVTIFPNPASEQIQVTGNYDYFKLYNNLGQIVLESSNTNSTYGISHLNQGQYFMQIENKGTLTTKHVSIL